MSQTKPISISIVIHHQALIVERLLDDLQKYCSNEIEVLLTLNVRETVLFSHHQFDFPFKTMVNQKPKGFGANHNIAFQKSEGNYFCIMNPDIRLNDNPFPFLIKCFDSHNTGVVAPLIVDPHFKIEDSARRFPTPVSIFKKALKLDGGFDYAVAGEQIHPDWVAGMFMLFSRERFREVGGFNEKFFLYYEDVDLCARLSLAGYQVILCPSVKAIHEAQRASHKSFEYLKWHISSAFRFFFSKVFFDVALKKRTSNIRFLNL